jgi:hypothetical protein
MDHGSLKIHVSVVLYPKAEHQLKATPRACQFQSPCTVIEPEAIAPGKKILFPSVQLLAVDPNLSAVDFDWFDLHAWRPEQ